jgi:hypothetical protein
MRHVCGICGQEWERSGGHVCKAHVESAVVCGEHGPQEFAECPVCYEKLETQVVALQEKVERLTKGIKMAHLHLLVSVCDCGEHLEDTDAFDCLDALLAEEK